MKLTTVALSLAILACTSHAFSLPKLTDNQVAPNADYGEQVKVVVDGLLASIAEGEPIPIELIPELRINITEILASLIGANVTSPIKGNMVITDPAIALKPGGVCESASVILNGIVQPLNLDVLVSLPGAGLVGDYSIDAIVLGIIPVRGAGRFYFGLDVSAGIVDTSLKFKLGSSNGTFTKFDYVFDLRSIDISLEGLIGTPDLSDLINQIINDFINKELSPVVVSLEATLRPFIRAILHDILDVIAQPITYQMILDLLNPKP
jgi:hypothetical protein